MDEIQEAVRKNEQGKKSKLLWSAYEVAAENHDLEHFKMMLQEHQTAVVMEAEQREAAKRVKEEREIAKASREAKKSGSSRKSFGGDSEDDAMDVDDNPPKSAKSSRKRKADADADTDNSRVSALSFSRLGYPTPTTLLTVAV